MNKYILLALFSCLLSQNTVALENDIATETKRENEVHNFNDYEEVIMNHIKLNNNNNSQIITAKENTLYYIPPIAINNSELKNSSDKNSTNGKDSKNEIYYMSGYCFAGKKPIEVSRLSSYSYLRCNFDKITSQNKTKIPDYLSSASLATLLVPDAFSKALIGKPLYISNGDNRLSVLGGVIMNYEKSSINLAHIVNDRKIATFIAKSGINTAETVTTKAQEYLDAKIAASVSKEVAYNSSESSDQTIVVENTAEPEIKDYLFGAGIQIVSELVSTGSELFIEDLPYIFKTRENAVYFVDIAVSKDYQSLPNINVTGTSLTKESNIDSAKTATEISVSEQKGK